MVLKAFIISNKGNNTPFLSILPDLKAVKANLNGLNLYCSGTIKTGISVCFTILPEVLPRKTSSFIELLLGPTTIKSIPNSSFTRGGELSSPFINLGVSYQLSFLNSK